ncbi:MAG: efflux RND transporter periplasmic adaptor subunit [Sporocytophaga sp.]|uniref:efflux RND transporter periplasmic adaptor subunit n=1 Tax=Sporocytophaga sp. TaxID=2231183 RepID=UPI001B0F3D25|nr:efflux RND transporter periplasmic adaptor subunit [Sporocytophaga sp.]MBO9699496.1 efflux RND transporter periplasmic adaptor subunit [Sporocytophaga sp.]
MKRRKIKIIPILILLVVLAGFFLIGLLPKIRNKKLLNEEANEKINSTQPVILVKAIKTRDTTTIELPGEVRAFKETQIFARVNGYIKKWYTDIGTSVNNNQLLAEIETPEIDQQLAQTKASLSLAKANYDRISSVRIPGAVSKQEIDQARTSYEANLAIVRQTEAMLSFKTIRAPFAGIVTARNVDFGSLISPSNTIPMFKVEQIDILRTYVNVPQVYSSSITPGITTEVILEKFPEYSIKGQVARTAEALDPASRTLLTEIHVKNSDLKLRPGMYVQVRFKPAREGEVVFIPANTLIIRAEGTEVATLDKDNTVTLKEIKIARDYGKFLAIYSGINGDEWLVTNPTDKLTNGTKVNVVGKQQASFLQNTGDKK